VPEDLSQGHQVVRVVREEPFRHGVTEEMRVDLLSDDRCVLVAESPHTLLGQGSTATNEDPLARDWWPSLEPSRQSPSALKGERHGSLLVSFARAESG
jgi:hypothetical protein